MRLSKTKLLSFFVISLFIGSIVSPVIGVNNSFRFNDEFDKNFLFEKFLRLYVKICRIPSMSSCIINDDEIIWSNNYGYLDPEIKKESDEDSIYLVMSISKPVAATALMQLWEKGLFNLDEDVNNYLPFSLRNPNYQHIPITFRMLLAHQSSLAYDEERGSYSIECLQKTLCLGDPDVSSYPYPWLENYLCPSGDIYNPEVWVDEEPGSNYHYANVGYALIGYLVEIISGQEFNEYCKNYIFTPLGMMNTSFYYRDLNNSNICIPYACRDTIPKMYRQPLYCYLWAACADLKTTINDLSRFIIAHMHGGLYDDVRTLNESTVKLMHTIQYPDNPDDKYGLGFMIKEDKNGVIYYGHDGGGPGVHTRMLVRSSDNTAFIYFLTTSTLLTWKTAPFIEKLYFRQIDKIT